MQDLQALVKAAQAGDTQAFAQIVRRFQDMAFGYAYAMLGDFHLAEDVAQEAFIQAYHSLGKLRDCAAFAGWFRQIVRFRCSRVLRNSPSGVSSSDGTCEPAPVQSGPERTAQDHEMAEAVLRAIGSLSAPLREATTLFYIDGYSHKEISAFLDVPVNTVKSRLNTSRRKLSERVAKMARQAFDAHGLGDDFAGRVIEGVPRVGFYQRGNVCPESFPFPSCLGACLRHMGEDDGVEEMDVHGGKWLLNKTYVYLMGVSGEAFRLFWRPDWDPGNSGVLSITSDSRQFFDGAFNGIGRAHEIINKQDKGTDESVFRQRIIESIRDKGRPVLGFGVVGPPECCIITGFDRGADVLMRWSFFQEQPDWSAGIDIEPCGYFRKRNWFADTWALVLIGDKHDALDRDRIYRAALRRAVDLIRRPTIRLDGEWHSGLAAYTAWAATIVRHEKFPQNDVALRRRYHMTHTATVGMVAEGRWYGSLFLKRVAAEMPAMAEPLLQAVACFEKEHGLMWQIWGLMGGHGFDDDKVENFADLAIREKMAPIIHEARDLDSEAAEYMERPLSV